MTWRPAKSLDVLLIEINAEFPRRDKASDGAKGDAAHAGRKSDHNPDANGIVRARDYDEDLDGDGVPSGERHMAVIANHVRALGETGFAPLVGGEFNGYVIYEGRIAGAGKGWQWRPYTGPNAHKHHMHVSVCSDPHHYDSTAGWGIHLLFLPAPPLPEPEDDDMPQIYVPSDDNGKPIPGRPAVLRIGNEYTELASEVERDQWLAGGAATLYYAPPGMCALVNHLATHRPRQ